LEYSLLAFWPLHFLFPTFANWSNLPKSSLRSLTNSCAEHCEDKEVKPTMSAKRILKKRERKRAL